MSPHSLGPQTQSRPLIRVVDPYDDGLFQAWYAAMHAGATTGREAPKVVTYEALSASLRTPTARKKRTTYGAFVDDTIVGTAMLDLPMNENRHLAEVDINVPPAQRGRGFGAALFDRVHTVATNEHRTTFLTEVNVPAGLGVDEWPGSRFALRHGFASEHQEDHLVLDLPVDPDVVERLTRAIAMHHRDYDMRTWTGACPDELVDAYASMQTVMGQDVPIGNLDYTPPALDADRVRHNDERMAAQGYTSITTVARHAGGELAGYSLMFVDANDPSGVSQDDTLVMRAHRGHRLGVALKLANLGVLTRDYPERRMVHTWTAGVNGPMQHINIEFGFRKVEQMHEFQRVDQT